MKDSTAKRIILWTCIIVFGGGGTYAWWDGHHPSDHISPSPIVVHQNANGDWVYKDGRPLWDSNGHLTWEPRYFGEKLVIDEKASEYNGWYKSAVNSIAHSYLTPEREKDCPCRVIVDADLFKRMRQETCPHSYGSYFYDQMEFCKYCHKCMAVTSYRG